MAKQGFRVLDSDLHIIEQIDGKLMPATSRAPRTRADARRSATASASAHSTIVAGAPRRRPRYCYAQRSFTP
jgi:hypothetical protein